MYWFLVHLHTKFAALVEHGNNQVIDIPATSGPLEFSYDEEWLAITRAHNPVFPPTPSRDLDGLWTVVDYVEIEDGFCLGQKIM